MKARQGPIIPKSEEKGLDVVAGGTEEESDEEIIDGDLGGEEGLRMKLDQ